MLSRDRNLVWIVNDMVFVAISRLFHCNISAPSVTVSSQSLVRHDYITTIPARRTLAGDPQHHKWLQIIQILKPARRIICAFTLLLGAGTITEALRST
jgi:hypothetical protein